VLPAPVSVRLEDFVNYFEYQYPTPPADAEVPFSVALAAADHPLGGELSVLRVALQGKAAPEQEKKPANLTFLVDVSGSMQSSDKLPLVQQVLRQTLDLLEPDDTVSIVTYASDTRVRLAPTPAASRSRILSEINALSAGGSTAGASGIQLAYDQASAAFIEGGINHVVLCTDGDFNVGPSSNRELVDLITQKRKSGITLTALGFGTDNLNDDMMEAVSNAGNGYYGYIGSEDGAAKYVRERMLATMTLIAKDVKVQVELNPEFVQAYRLLGYENRSIADDDFRDDIIDAGEVGSGHRVTALYEIVRAGGAMPAVTGAPAPSDGEPYEGAVEVQAEELARVKLRYKAVDATETDPALEVVSSLPPAVLSQPAAADLDLTWAAGMAAFAEILKESPYERAAQLEELDALFADQADRDVNRQQFYQSFRKAMY
jgi:Ca-activated chloride channel homolog